MRPLSEQQFNQLQAGLIARLDRLGRIETHDQGGRRHLRKVRLVVHVPGQVGELRLPDEIRLEYEEWYRRTRLGWVRVRYNYNYFDLLTGGRWGFHLHQIPGSRGTSVPHLVCVLPSGSGEGRHYAAHEVELLAAHDLFEQHYASGRPVSCTGLNRID